MLMTTAKIGGSRFETAMSLAKGIRGTSLKPIRDMTWFCILWKWKV